MLKNQLIKLIFIAFLGCGSACLFADESPRPNEGIAFVHGTSDHREDAYGDYWKVDFIQSVSQALPNPNNYFVVHCDFSQFMWHEEAGDCVAQQLNEFIRDKHLTAITVYTHSNGGNVVRWILSNPTYNSAYAELADKVKQVVAIAPSSGGSLLADEVFHGGYFETNLAWLLDYTSDALRQQRVGDMLIYNEELLLGTKNRPSLAVPFRAIVGTDVDASPFSSQSFCNGYMINVALKVSKLYLDDCSDGVINCSSQTSAGSLLFYDIDETDDKGPISHNQSRHSCHGLDKLLRKALSLEGVSHDK